MSDQSDTFKIEQKQAVALCQSAADLLSRGEISLARDSLMQALKHRPSSALAFKLLGDLHSAIGDDGGARVCYRNELPVGILSDSGVTSGPADYARIPVFASEQTTVPEPGRVAEQCAFDKVQLSSNECFIDKLSNGTLWHDDLNTLACDQSGAVVLQHTVGCADLIHALKTEHKPVFINGRVILAGAKGAHNFYHWTTDIIPKFLVLEAAGFQLEDTDTIVVSRASASYARQLLAHFNVQPDQVMETESSSPFIQAEELILPYLNNKMGYGMGSWLPDHMRHKLGVCETTATKRRLFVNRRSDTAAGRTLENSGAAEEFFRYRDYEVVYPELLSVQEQAQLFGSASVVAGVHGAGLANIVYCRPGTQVIEFYGAHIAPCYWLISALSGFDYYQHPCQSVNAPGTNRHAAGLSLPLDEIELLLSRAEQHERSNR